MKRFGFLLHSVVLFVPLAFAVLLTLRVQGLWLTGDPLAMFFPVVLWLVLITGWVLRYQPHRTKKGELERRARALPVCVLFVVACGITNIPIRVLFWTQKSALEAAEKQPPFARSFDGHLHPFQLAKSNGDTRFFIWESRGLADKTAIGFVHCPNDAGCGRASFGDSWDTSNGTPVLVHTPREFYWDYNNGRTNYVSLGNGWYAMRVSAEDVGD